MTRQLFNAVALDSYLWFWVALFYATAMTPPAIGARPYDAVGNIHAPITPWEASGGSGTLVSVKDGYGYVITAAHVLEGTRSVSIKFPATDASYQATVIRTDVDRDVAALRIKAPEGIEPAYGVNVARKEDGPFIRVGFPYYGQGKQHWNKGEYLGYPTSGESAWSYGMFHTSGTVVSGFSGGAVFNKHGELVAVISGNTGDSMMGCDRVWGVGGETLVEFCQSCCGPQCQPYYPQQQQPRPPTIGGTSDVKQPALEPEPSDNTEQWKAWITATIDARLEKIKQCECADKDYATTIQINQLKAEMNQVIADIDIPTIPPAYQPPTPEELAEQITPHLKHSATITLLDGTTKTQTKPLTDPLNFIQHAKGVK